MFTYWKMNWWHWLDHLVPYNMHKRSHRSSQYKQNNFVFTEQIKHYLPSGIDYHQNKTPTKNAKTCQHRSIFSAGLLLLNFPPPSNSIIQNLINLPQYTLSSNKYEDNVSTYIIRNRNMTIVFWFPLGTETSRLRVQMLLLSFGRLQLNFVSEHDNFF